MNNIFFSFRRECFLLFSLLAQNSSWYEWSQSKAESAEAECGILGFILPYQALKILSTSSELLNHNHGRYKYKCYHTGTVLQLGLHFLWPLQLWVLVPVLFVTQTTAFQLTRAQCDVLFKLVTVQRYMEKKKKWKMSLLLHVEMQTVLWKIFSIICIPFQPQRPKTVAVIF